MYSLAPRNRYTQPPILKVNQQYQLLHLEASQGERGRVQRLLTQFAGFRFQLRSADALHEGLALLDEAPADLILLSLQLSDTTGFKCLTRLLERTCRCPIIVISDTTNEIIGNQAVKAGAQDFLVKGQFDGRRLARSVRYSLQRYQTQQQLQETQLQLAITEQRFQDAQRLARIGSWELDLVEQRMNWSAALYELLDHPPGGLSPTQADYLRLSHHEDRERVRAFFAEVIQTTEPQHIEHRLLLKGHRVRYVSMYALLRYDEPTEKMLLTGSLQDVTERVVNQQLKVEAGLHKQVDRIRHAALHELGFEVRTPLSTAIQFLHLLDKKALPDNQLDYYTGLQRSIESLRIATNNLLNFSVLVGKEAPAREQPFTPQDTVEQLLRVVQLKVSQADLRLHCQGVANLPDRLSGDAQRISQVLYNLLENAIQYTPAGGRIYLQFDLEEQYGQQQLVVHIEDTGQGMTPDQLDGLDQAEYRLATYEGNATPPMGWAISQKLLRSMSGVLDVRSRPGQGTRCEVRIPVGIELADRFTEASEPACPLRILLVEDHFLSQLATKRILTNWSAYVKVSTAANGKLGWQQFRKGSFDLVLMDLQMPVMDGIESTLRIREHSSVPIIALTARSSSEEQDRCLAAGMNDYLPKPFQPADLYRRIIALLSTVKS